MERVELKRLIYKKLCALEIDEIVNISYWPYDNNLVVELIKEIIDGYRESKKYKSVGNIEFNNNYTKIRKQNDEIQKTKRTGME